MPPANLTEESLEGGWFRSTLVLDPSEDPSVFGRHQCTVRNPLGHNSSSVLLTGAGAEEVSAGAVGCMGAILIFFSYFVAVI